MWARTRVGGSKGRVRARMIARRGPGVKKKVRDRSSPYHPLGRCTRAHADTRTCDREIPFFSPPLHITRSELEGGWVGGLGWEETCIRCRTRGRRAGPAFSVDFSSFFTGDGSLLSRSFSFFRARSLAAPAKRTRGRTSIIYNQTADKATIELFCAFFNKDRRDGRFTAAPDFSADAPCAPVQLCAERAYISDPLRARLSARLTPTPVLHCSPVSKRSSLEPRPMKFHRRATVYVATDLEEVTDCQPSK